jgi:predicted RND superfamily exporter protein/signal transduction histidine kinase
MNLACALTRLSLERPLIVAVALFVITSALASGVSRVETQTTAQTFLGDDHPLLAAYDEHIARFSAGYPIVIAYSCAKTPVCDTIFDAAALDMVVGVAERLSQHPMISRLRSIASEPVLLAYDSKLVRRYFTDEGLLESERERMVDAALDDPMWRRSLIGSDAEVGAILIEVKSTQGKLQSSLANALEQALEPAQKSGWSFYLAGELIDFTYTGAYLERESTRMAGPLALVLLFVLLTFLRSTALAIVTLLSVVLAYVWTSGAMGWSGFKVNALTSATPSLVMAIAVLDGVHLLTRWVDLVSRSRDRSLRKVRALLVEAAREIGQACFLTSITTIAAFMAFLGVGISAFTEFGLIAAFGVASSFVLTFTLLPVFLRLVPGHWIRGGAVTRSWDGLIEAIIAIARRRSRAVLFGASLLFSVSLIGVQQVRVDVLPEELVGVANPVTKWGRWVAKHLRATEGLELSLTAPPGTRVTESASIEWISRICAWLDDELPGVHHSRSVRDVLSRAGSLRGGAAYDESASDLGLWRRLESVDRSTLEEWLGRSTDRTAGFREVARVSAEVDGGLPTSHQRELIESIRRYLDTYQPAGWSYSIVGSTPLYVLMMETLERNQIRSFAAAGLTILLMTSVAFRSWRIGLLAMIPSILPCAVVLGVLGWSGVSLNPSSTMVATIVLGLGVDGSIHILWADRRARREGTNRSTTELSCIRQVGIPVIASSLMLAAGFVSLSFFGFGSVAVFGLLAGLAVLCSLTADLLVIPSLLHKEVFSSAEQIDGAGSNIRQRDYRVRTSLVCLAVVIGTAAQAGWTLRNADPARLGCGMLPDASVSLSGSLMIGCPIRPYEQVTHVLDAGRAWPVRQRADVVEHAVGRDQVVVRTLYKGQSRVVEIPALAPSGSDWVVVGLVAALSLALLGFGVVLLWGSAAPSAAPVALLFTLIANAILIGALRESVRVLDWTWPVAQALVPAATVHLAVALREYRPYAHALHPLVKLSYVLAGIGLAFQASAVANGSSAWRIGDFVLSIFAVGAATALLVSALRTWGDGPTRRARAQARTLAWLVLGLLTLGLGIPAVLGAAATESQREWFGVGLAGLFISLLWVAGDGAIADVSPRFRAATAYVLQVGVIAAALALAGLAWPISLEALNLRRPIVLCAALFGCLAGLDCVRRVVARLARVWVAPFEESPSNASVGLASALAKGLGEDQISQCVGEAVSDRIRPRGIAVLLCVGESGWRRAYARGQIDAGADQAQDAVHLRENALSAKSRVLLLDEMPSSIDPACRDLLRSGIEAVVFVSKGRRTWGVVLLTNLHSRMTLARLECDFLEVISEQAAVALEGAAMREQSLIDERARVSAVDAAGLAHDLARPLEEIRLEAELLAKEVSGAEISDSARAISEAAQESLNRLNTFYELARSQSVNRRVGRVDHLIAAAADRVRRVHRGRCLSTWINAGDACVEDAPSMQRAIENLLENALRWGGERATVRLEVRRTMEAVTITVDDDGRGMTDFERERALRPFESGGGGQGLGLAICEDVARCLGGEFALTSVPGKGTRALLRVPLMPSH